MRDEKGREKGMITRGMKIKENAVKNEQRSEKRRQRKASEQMGNVRKAGKEI